GATPKRPEPMTAAKAYRDLLKALPKWLPILRTGVDSIQVGDGGAVDDLAILEQAQDLVPRPIERVQQAQEARLQHRRSMDKDIAELQQMTDRSGSRRRRKAGAEINSPSA